MKNDLPQFSKLDPSSVETHLTELLKNNMTEIKKHLLNGKPFNWDNFMRPLEDIDDRLSQFWTAVSHLNAVVNSPELREAYNACLPKLSDYSTELSHNKDYYDAVKSIADSDNFKALDFAQKKLIEHELRDFKLSGIALPPEQKKTFAELSKTLSQLTSKFEENILDSTHDWTKLVKDEKELEGLPDFAIQAAADAAKKRNLEGWLFTLEIPSYLAVITHAHSKALREEMYYAFTTRASDIGPCAGKHDNSEIMIKILKARLELSKLLGFKNYAEYSLATKMVGNTNDVITFLDQLVNASLEKAKEEYAELQQFAKEHLNIDTLEAWDAAYASEKLRQERYAISQEDIRPYFPEPQVLDGLFKLVQNLFDIHIKPVKDADTWHPDAKCFEITDSDNNPVSYFYTDLYARPSKRGGAWMNDCRMRRRLDNNNIQTPIAFIVCNFNPPVGNDPALLTHDDVVTLFHEFGHSLQHMLTKVDYPDVSGISGIPWDAVEIASQFMENYAWSEEVLTSISSHYQTKEPLPKSMLEKMRNAKNFQSALQMMRQLEFSLFDFRLHMEFDPNKKNQIEQILEDVRQRVRVIPSPEYNRFQHSFSHIFAGGYAAGYYSYKWAEVMAHDAFSLFKEKGIFDKATSKKFQQTFLEMGGAKEPLDLFIEFRGRKPKVEALLKDAGIID